MVHVTSSQLHAAIPNGPSQGQNDTHNITAQDQNCSNPSQTALIVLSVNIEGFSENKSQILSDLCTCTGCDFLCVQEIHRDSVQPRPQVPGMTLVAEIPHPKYGSAIFTKPPLSIKSVSSTQENDIEIITVETSNCTVTSVYKPPNTPFKFAKTTNFDSHPIKIVVGDFNSHSTSWGYAVTDSDGEAVEQWAEGENLTLIHDAKLPPSFNSRRWLRGYNPDLIFASGNISSLCVKNVCGALPYTQHRPIACVVQAAVKPVLVPFRRRFNFRKADWQKYLEQIDSELAEIDPTPTNYDQFVQIVWNSSRKNIPRGCRRFYVPGLNNDSAKLLTHYQSLFEKDPFSEETLMAGEELMHLVAESRKESWMKLISSVDMTHNSKKAWSTVKKLTGEAPAASNPGQVTANQVAHQLLLNGKSRLRVTRAKLNNNTETSNTISKPFVLSEIISCIKTLQSGKATGMDDITTEQIKHLGPVAVSWLLAMFNCCLRELKVPKIWRRAKVIAILKPSKSPSDPKNYRPISLLCHTFKLFERMLLNRLTPVLEPLLLPEQAGFRPGKSCTSQTLSLVQHIEDGFETHNVTGVVFVDLTAAYDTVNIRKLLTKVYDTTKDMGFVNILREVLNNRRFQVHLHGDKSRWRCQKNGLPQGSVLAPALFNIYTNDQPITPRTKSFLYADDLALAAQAPSFEEVETLLQAGLDALDKYYAKNTLRPNPSKTHSCAFHIRNRDAKRALALSWRGVNIEHCAYPRYLGITLDRTLTYKAHCLNTKQKVGARNNLLRRLTSTAWGANPHVLRTTGLSLSYTAGEYACPVWHRSTHAKEVDVALNETCRIITGCLKPTPLNKIYPLAGIAPPNVRREVASAVEKHRQETDPRHPLHNKRIPRARLKSRQSFLRSTTATNNTPRLVREQLWRTKFPIPPNFPEAKESLPPGHDLKWPTWRSLNRLRSQVGRCRVNMAKWGYMDQSQVHCDCGAPRQSMAHLLSCPLCPSTCSKQDLKVASDNAVTVAKFWEDKI